MQARYFGSQKDVFNLSDPIYLSFLPQMTAIATIYTSSGFAVAADGRQRWAHEPTRDIAIRESESDTVQKIFAVNRERTALAYTMQGDIANRDRSFDFGVELRDQIVLLQTEEFVSCNHFVMTLAENLEKRIEGAMQDGRLEDQYPKVRVSFIGYFQEDPCWIDVQFLASPDFYGRLYQLIHQSLYPGLGVASGSLLIRDLILGGDPRFAKFLKRIDHTMSLEDAAEFCRGYVEACSSRLALQLDPTCFDIGGHIHVATVTLKQGFEWVIPPLKTSA
jgi:hypothetical protein